ncbi:MAG: O-antigen ligase family protein [Elusimicrobiota bacterium]
MTSLFGDLVLAGLLMGGLRESWQWALALALFCALAARRTPARGAVPAALWAWGAWALLCALVSPEPLVALPAAARLLLPLPVLAACAGSFREEERSAWLLRLQPAALLFVFASFFLSRPDYPWTGLLPPHHGYTGALLAAAFAAACAALLAPGGPSPRPVRLALSGAALVAGAACAAASSRAALLGCGSALALLLWRSGRRRALLAAAVLLLALAAFVPAGLWVAALKLDHPAASVRPSIWGSALRVVRANPILGTGPGRFERGYLLERSPAPSSFATNYGMSTAYAHSEPLQSAAETGLVGLLLLLAGVGTLLLRAARARPASWSREAALAACAALLAQASVDDIFALPGLAALFAYLLAAAQPPAEAARPSRAWGAFCAAGALLAVVSPWTAWTLRGLSLRDDSASIEKALGLAPADDALWEALARARLREGGRNVGPALAMAERLSPTNALRPMLRSELRRAEGDWRGMAEAAARAWKLEPASPHARLQMAEAAARLGATEAAGPLLAQARWLRAREEERRRLAGGPPDGYNGFVLSIDPTRFDEVSSLLRESDKRIPVRVRSKHP